MRRWLLGVACMGAALGLLVWDNAGGRPTLAADATPIPLRLAYGAPVVVLLYAQSGLPNWPGSGGVGHYITIVGYNDDASLPNGPEYAYMDTCGASTNCNSYDGSGNYSGVHYANSDGGVKRAPQSQLFGAIQAYGDWIW